jgi:hypothetical protein
VSDYNPPDDQSLVDSRGMIEVPRKIFKADALANELMKG